MSLSDIFIFGGRRKNSLCKVLAVQRAIHLSMHLAEILLAILAIILVVVINKSLRFRTIVGTILNDVLTCLNNLNV